MNPANISDLTSAINQNGYQAMNVGSKPPVNKTPLKLQISEKNPPDKAKEKSNFLMLRSNDGDTLQISQTALKAQKNLPQPKPKQATIKTDGDRNPSEPIIISEPESGQATPGMVDRNEDFNFSSSPFDVRVIYKPANKMLFNDSVSLEKSIQVEKEPLSAQKSQSQPQQPEQKQATIKTDGDRNPSEPIIISEPESGQATPGMIDMVKDFNFSSSPFDVKIIYEPTNKMIFQSTVSLEDSIQVEKEPLSAQSDQSQAQQPTVDTTA